MIPVGERHFRRAIMEFVEHYHLERNHQGLNNQLITRLSPADAAGHVRRRARLGGLLNYYERARRDHRVGRDVEPSAIAMMSATVVSPRTQARRS
jgi:hypothetical protein